MTPNLEHAAAGEDERVREEDQLFEACIVDDDRRLSIADSFDQVRTLDKAVDFRLSTVAAGEYQKCRENNRAPATPSPHVRTSGG